MKLTAEETELLMNSVDLSITNVSMSIGKMESIEKKAVARELLIKLLELNKKISNVQVK